MPSVKIVLHNIKPNKVGQIHIRVIENRKSRYHKTGYYVKQSQFVNEQVIRHVDAKMINMAVEAQRSKLMQKYYQADIAGEATRELTLFQAITAKLNELDSSGKVATYNRLHTNLRYLKEIIPGDIKISKINSDIVEKYVAFRYEKGNKGVTVRKNLKDLSSVMVFSGFVGIDPFLKKANTINAIPANREKLTIDEIEAFEKAEVSGIAQEAKDMFLFSYYMHGARFESVATFKRENIRNVIRYQMNKGMKFREIDIHNKLKAIIDRYINNDSVYLFPVIKQEVTDKWMKKDIIGTANALIGRYLKIPLAVAGITKPISFHCARHTFACIAYESGVNTDVIRECLGHTNIGTTMKYLRSLSDKALNDSVNKIYV